MCMGGCGGKSTGKASGMKQMPKNWGGMKTTATGNRGSKNSSGNSGNFGTPKVRMSFGTRGR